MRFVRRCVSGRAGRMSALAKDRLGNREYWEFWDYWELWEFFAPGCAGKSPCEQPFLCPRSLSTLSIPSTPRTRAAKRFRQSRWDGRTHQGFAGENGRERTETVQNGEYAWVRGEWLSVDFRFPPLIPVPFRFSRQSRRDERTRQGLAGEVQSVRSELRVRCLRRGARGKAYRTYKTYKTYKTYPARMHSLMISRKVRGDSFINDPSNNRQWFAQKSDRSH